MFLIIIAVLSIIVALIRGGKFSNLVENDFTAPFLFVLSLLLFMAIKVGNMAQISIIENYTYYIQLAAYFVLLIACIINLSTLSIGMVLVGSLLNFAVIFLNGGKLPLSSQMMTIAKISEESIAASPLYTVATGSSYLAFLGGVIPIPLPSVLAQVISPGTVVTAIGLFLLIQELFSDYEYDDEDEEDDEDDEYEDEEEIEEVKPSKKKKEPTSRERKKAEKLAKKNKELLYDDDDDLLNDIFNLDSDYTENEIDTKDITTAAAIGAIGAVAADVIEEKAVEEAPVFVEEKAPEVEAKAEVEDDFFDLFAFDEPEKPVEAAIDFELPEVEEVKEVAPVIEEVAPVVEEVAPVVETVVEKVADEDLPQDIFNMIEDVDINDFMTDLGENDATVSSFNFNDAQLDEEPSLEDIFGETKAEVAPVIEEVAPIVEEVAPVVEEANEVFENSGSFFDVVDNTNDVEFVDLDNIPDFDFDEKIDEDYDEFFKSSDIDILEPEVVEEVAPVVEEIAPVVEEAKDEFELVTDSSIDIFAEEPKAEEVKAEEPKKEDDFDVDSILASLGIDLGSAKGEALKKAVIEMVSDDAKKKAEEAANVVEEVKEAVVEEVAPVVEEAKEVVAPVIEEVKEAVVEETAEVVEKIEEVVEEVEEEIFDTDSPFVIKNGRIIENPNYKFKKTTVAEEPEVTQAAKPQGSMFVPKTRNPSFAGRPTFSPTVRTVATNQDKKEAEFERIDLKIGNVSINSHKDTNE